MTTTRGAKLADLKPVTLAERQPARNILFALRDASCIKSLPSESSCRKTPSVLLFASVLFVGICYLKLFLLPHYVVDYDDVGGYLWRSQQSIFSLSFFVSARPFFTDLFYKICGSDPDSIVVGQHIVCTAAWTYLGVAVSFLVRPLWLKCLSIGIFAGASLSWTMLGWSHVIFSESLSTSLFALWTASLLMWISFKGTRWLLLLMGVTLAFCFTRDNVALFVLATAIGLLAATIMSKSILLRRRSVLVYLVFCSVVTAAVFVSVRIGERQVQPLINVFLNRFLPYQDRYEWLLKQGMPATDEFRSQWNGRLAQANKWDLWYNEQHGEFMEWIRTKGSRVYLHYLLSHPRYTATTLSKERDRLIETNFSWYTRPPPDSFIVRAATKLWVLRPVTALVALGFWILALVRYRKSDDTLIVVIPALLLVTLAFNALLIFHADYQEVERHSLMTTVGLEMLCWFAIMLGLDRAVRCFSRCGLGREARPH